MINQEMLKHRIIELSGVDVETLERIEREVMCVVGRMTLSITCIGIIQTIEFRLQTIISIMVREKTSWMDKSIASELLYAHTRRVMKTASKMIKYSPCDIDGLNKDNLRIAILGHDIGKLFAIKQHPIYSVFIMELIMRDLNISDVNKIEILEAILIHSKKDVSVRKELNIIDKLLMDADMLENKSVEYMVGKLNQVNYCVSISKSKQKVLYDKLIEELNIIKNANINKYPSIKSEYGRLYFDDMIKSYDEFIDKIYEENTTILCSDIEL